MARKLTYAELEQKLSETKEKLAEKEEYIARQETERFVTEQNSYLTGKVDAYDRFMRWIERYFVSEARGEEGQ